MSDFRKEAAAYRYGSREARILIEAADKVAELQSQVDRVNKLADHCVSIAPDAILDRRTCAELIKAAIKGEQKP